jgi:hypothetical protein
MPWGPLGVQTVHSSQLYTGDEIPGGAARYTFSGIFITCGPTIPPLE